MAINGLRAVCVTRPLIWSNPFIADNPQDAVDAYEALIRGGTATFAMGQGGLHFSPSANPKTLHWAFPDFVAAHLHEIRGVNLACYCALGAPCHRDVLLRRAAAL